ncbi:MAG: hypothetical protein JSU72_00700 [Deltaproteobacteria bacterium]|nr:MAG: hypothetical protein JSU72_00700 [Deltaproteobacteria bacterium]
MRRPSRVMIIRELQEALWQMLEPQIDSSGFNNDLDRQIMKTEIQRFVEYEARSLNMAELADALDSLEQTAALFLEYLRGKGTAGDPIVGL